MKRLRLAVVGAGHLGTIHARLAAANPDFELVGIVDPIPTGRDVLASELNLTPWDDHHALIGHVDAAIIATPTQHHHRVAAELLRCGIHLLVEKPLTATVAEADELVSLARQGNCVLQAGHVERFNPVLAAAAALLESPLYIEARRYCLHSFRSTDISVVLDLMIHDLDLVLSMCDGPPVEISALGTTVLGPHTDVATARLVFENGCVAQLSASRVSYQACREMQVWSAGGFASLDFATATAKIVRPSDMVRQRNVFCEGLAPAERQTMRDRLFTDLLPLSTVTATQGNAIAEEQGDFAAAIQTGRAPRVTGEQGRAALAAAEAVELAIARHTWREPTSATHVGRDVLPGPHANNPPTAPVPPRNQRKAG